MEKFRLLFSFKEDSRGNNRNRILNLERMLLDDDMHLFTSTWCEKPVPKVSARRNRKQKRIDCKSSVCFFSLEVGSRLELEQPYLISEYASVVRSRYCAIL